MAKKLAFKHRLRQSEHGNLLLDLAAATKHCKTCIKLVAAEKFHHFTGDTRNKFGIIAGNGVYPYILVANLGDTKEIKRGKIMVLK